MGDQFLDDCTGAYRVMEQAANKDKKKKEPPPYIHEYFNVKIFSKPRDSAESAIERIVDSLMDAINAKGATIPKILVVVTDGDILLDIEDIFDEETAIQSIQRHTNWLVRKINTKIRRKRSDILEVKPGAVYGCETSIIFVKMIRRIGSFNENSVTGAVFSLRNKFNDALNDAVAKVDQRILTINHCCTYEDFTKSGKLSPKGKDEFWLELDNLIERFDNNKLKLLPNPKNPPRQKAIPFPSYPQFLQNQHRQMNPRKSGMSYPQNNARRDNKRCKLPTPPRYYEY